MGIPTAAHIGDQNLPMYVTIQVRQKEWFTAKDAKLR